MVVEHAHGLRQRRGPNAKSSLHKAHLAPDAGLQAPGASLSFAQGSHDFESLDRGIGRGDPVLQASQGLAQEPLRCLGAAGRRQVEIDRVAPLVDCPVQVGPLAPHLDVGFIQAPARIKATPPEPAQPLLHLRGVALDPAIDRRMVDRNAAFRQHFLKVAIADRIATIPAHRPQDHITLEMAPLEIRHRSVRPISAKHAQASRFLQQSPTRRALINDLLETSASPGESEILRAVEVTIVVHDDIIPWRYPAKRELQFGEWQRNDILAGIFEPATIDIDLAILLTKAREHSVALVGPAAEELFDPVPEQDLFEALNETLTLWNSPPDWAGDERNVVLTLSRIWYSAVTGKIAPKDVAADWAMERLPAQYQPVILEARQAYLGQEDRLASRADQLEEFVHYVKGEITKVVGK